MESIIETGAETVRGFTKQLRAKVYVTLKKGRRRLGSMTCRGLLVTEGVVCDPRHNKVLKSGNKSDGVSARKLAELLRNGSLHAVYHGEKGARVLKELVRNYDCLV